MEEPMAAEAVSIDTIELSKENILPVRTGRSAAKLTSRLAMGSDQSAAKKALDSKRMEFERRIQDQKQHDDPLSIWLEYYQWVLNFYPNDKQEHLKVMERCTAAFRVDARYKQDLRFLRIWLLYADICSNAVDVFNYLLHKEIGTEWELLYSCKAAVLENLGKYKEAEEALKLGVNREAKPLDKMENNHKRFLERMALRVAKAKQAKADRELVKGSADSSKSKPSSRTGSSRSSQSARPEPRRRALGTLAGKKTIPLSTSAEAVDNGSTATALAVGPDADPADEKAGDAVEWSHFPTEEDRTKENTAAKEAWAGKTLPQKRKPPRKQPVESFDIFVEEDSDSSGSSSGMSERSSVSGKDEVPESDDDILEMIRRMKEQDLAKQRQAAPAAPSNDAKQQKRRAHKLAPGEYRGFSSEVLKQTDAHGHEVSFEELRAKVYLARLEQQQKRREAEQASIANDSQAERLADIRKKMNSMKDDAKEEKARAARRALEEKQQAEEAARRAAEEAARQAEENAAAQAAEELRVQREAEEEALRLAAAEAEEKAALAEKASLEAAAVEVPAPKSRGLKLPTNYMAGTSLLKKKATAVTTTPAVVKTPVEEQEVNALFPLSSDDDREQEDDFFKPYDDEATEDSFDGRNRGADNTLGLRADNTMFNVLDQTSFLNQTLHPEKKKFKEQTLTLSSKKAAQELMSEFSSTLTHETEESNSASFGFDNSVRDDDTAGFELYEDEEDCDANDTGMTDDSSLFMLTQPHASLSIPNDEELFADENAPCTPVAKENAPSRKVLGARPALLARADASSQKKEVEEILIFQDEDEEQDEEQDEPTCNPSGFEIFADDDEEESADVGLAQVEQTPAPPPVVADLSETIEAREPFDPFTTQHDLELLALGPVQQVLQEAAYFGCWRQSENPAPRCQASKLKSSRSFVNGALPEDNELPLFEVDFPSPHDEYANSIIHVGKLLGDGGYAQVYLVQHINPGEGSNWDSMEDCEDTEEMEVYTRALKEQSDKTSLQWEFYCASIIQRRLEQQLPEDEESDGAGRLNDLSAKNVFYSVAFMQERFCESLALCEFSNKGFLLMECSDQGTLQDVINAFRTKKAAVSEVLVAFFALELLSIMQVMHTVCNVIHGDLKPDNFLLMNKSSSSAWGDWSPSGGEGWEHRGLRLIDFGRSKDMTLYSLAEEQLFVGDSHHENFQCIQMRTDEPWNFELDLFGVCAIIHLLLHKDYMEAVEVVDEEDVVSWMPKKAFKRYWKHDWQGLFFDLMNDSNPDVDRLIGDLQTFLEKNQRQVKVELGKLNRLMQ